jgi:hypothetical protein
MAAPVRVAMSTMARGPVVGAHQIPGDRGLAAKGLELQHGGEDGPGPRHVVLHRGVDLIGRLEGDASGVIHDPLAHQGQVSPRP